jgi:ATP-dependent protease HslVU (ClpYQ) peptidase subunit
MPIVENEKIFVRRIKRGYLATYNGVKGKARTMFEAIEKAQRNYIEQDEANEINSANDYLEDWDRNIYERKTDYDTARSVD